MKHKSRIRNKLLYKHRQILRQKSRKLEDKSIWNWHKSLVSLKMKKWVLQLLLLRVVLILSLLCFLVLQQLLVLALAGVGIKFTH